MHRTKGEEEMSATGPPGDENAAPDKESGESETAINSTGVYLTNEFAATGKHLGQTRFAFDTGAAFTDRHIAAYLTKLGRELSDDQLRDFCHARYRYEIFQQSGAAPDRKYAWFAVQLLAVRLSAENRH